MTQSVNSAAPTWRHERLGVLTEAVDGGAPEGGAAFLDGTAADGRSGHGRRATLIVPWKRDGDRGPHDGVGRCLPAQVNEVRWAELRGHVQSAHDEVLVFLRTPGTLDGAAYHLRATRQMLKKLG